MREIARQVGVTAPAAYHHFKNLDAIAVGLAEAAAEEMVAALTEAANARAGNLLNMGKAYVGFALKNPQLYRLLFGDGLSITSPARAQVERIRQNVYNLIEREMLKLGERDDLYQRGIFLWSVAHGISLLLIDNQVLSENQDALVENVLKLAGKSLRS
jgi:AcrR family transcriptional regulator